jgi:hypothetical protein
MRRSIERILFAVLICGSAAAQQPGAILPAWKADEWQRRTDPLVFTLGATASAGETIAVFLDQVDITALFDVEGSTFRYRNAAPRPQPGEHQVIVYAIDGAGQWRELGRAPLKVLTDRGFTKSTIRPSLDLLNKGQLNEGHRPVTAAPPRDEFQDATLQGGLATEQERGDYTVRTAVNVTGVTYRKEALRFGTKGESAPLADLANYRVDLRRGNTELSVGHISFGNNRHLISGFGSRGAMLTVPLGRVASVQLGMANGSNIVGWDNPFGVTNDNHRILGLTLGVEAIPSQPGTLRLEATLLDGSVQPLDNYNQGAIRSAEISRGGGLRLLSSAFGGKVTVEGGVARSKFEASRDLQLEGGLPVVPLEETSRDAHYLEIGVAVLENRALTATQQANARVTYAVERIDPLYRSVVAYTQSDLIRQTVGVTGNVGPLLLQLTGARMHDNLDDVDSLLRTETEQRMAVASLNLGALWPKVKYVSLLPAISWGYTWTRQKGGGVPVDSGFNASHVPDQISDNLTAAIEWQYGSWRWGTRYNANEQDNRQPGRELSDFQNTSRGVYLGYQFAPRFDLTYDATNDGQDSLEFRTEDRTTRHGLTATWRPWGDLALAGNVSRARGSNNTRTQANRNLQSYFEVSSGFRLWRAANARPTHRVFLRYSNRDLESRNGFGTSSENSGWTLTSGLNLKVF